MGGTGEEAAFGGVPELTRINAITTAAAATMLPIIIHKSVRPRCIGSPRPSCQCLGNLASSPSQAAAHHLADLLVELDDRGAPLPPTSRSSTPATHTKPR